MKTEKRKGQNTKSTIEGEKQDRRKNMVIPYVTGVSKNSKEFLINTTSLATLNPTIH